jgi:hypothetical protein
MYNKLDLHSFIASVHAGFNTKLEFKDKVPLYKVLNLVDINTKLIPPTGARIFNMLFNIDIAPDQLLDNVSSFLKIVYNPALQPKAVSILNSMFNIYYTDTTTPQGMIINKSDTYNAGIPSGIDIFSLLNDYSIINFCFNKSISSNSTTSNKLNELYTLFTPSNNPMIKFSILFIAFLYRLCSFTGYSI